MPAAFLLALLLSPQGPPHDLPLARGRLTSLEEQAGWRMLFDGESTAGWRGFGREGFPESGWVVKDGCLVHEAGGGGGDIVTEAWYADFEFVFEWKAAPGANSGVKYRVGERPGQGSMLGPEYQILDDGAHGGRLPPKHLSGALYDLFPAAAGKVLRPAGEWNRARIVARGGRFEHWLNGIRVVAYTTHSEEWEQALVSSKFADVEGFGGNFQGHIGFQDHGDEVWFRDIRIRDLKNLPGERVEIFNMVDTTGWHATGDARWEVAYAALNGSTGGGGQSFLLTDRELADFVFEVDLRVNDDGNSGIQVRSHQRENGSVYGYQIEIDPSARSWSGGLYDEGRRGWLDDLSDNPAGRAAFRRHEVNTFRIECVGPWIRAWVNGVPTADHLDPLDLAGSIGLQVHSGSNTKIGWFNFRLQDLGAHRWAPALEGSLLRGWEPVAGEWQLDQRVLTGAAGADGEVRLASFGERADFTVRFHYRAAKGALLLGFRQADPRDAKPAAPPPESPLQAGPAGHVLALRPRGEAWVKIDLSAYGERIVVHEDDRLVMDRRAAEADRGGLFVMLQGDPGAELGLRGLAFLEPPSR